jgi:hypothetical protein
MKKYYFTFMNSQYALKDYWVEITAEDETEARKIMFDHWGPRWFSSYYETKFNPEYFPKGCLLQIIQR